MVSILLDAVDDLVRKLLGDGPRQGGARIDRRPADLQFDAAILRHATLGDVHRRHDLQARDDRALHALGDVVAFMADAVDAVAQTHAIRHRLNVDI